jgi:hypothetical protein
VIGALPNLKCLVSIDDALTSQGVIFTRLFLPLRIDQRLGHEKALI